jgi:type IV secretion system protein TrbG
MIKQQWILSAVLAIALLQPSYAQTSPEQAAGGAPGVQVINPLVDQINNENAARKKPSWRKVTKKKRYTKKRKTLSRDERSGGIVQRAKMQGQIGPDSWAAAKPGVITSFNYYDNAIYTVYTQNQHVTDIRLEPGERVTGDPVGGDTARWIVAIGKSGSESGEITHIFIKPRANNISTNIIIPTDRRVYHLEVKATKTVLMPAVVWSYPPKPMKPELAALAAEPPRPLYETVTPDQKNSNYAVKGKKRYWTPLEVFDDGVRTYFRMSPDVRVREAPVLYSMTDKGELSLVNYRVLGDFYIADRLMDRATLKLGKKDKIEIVKAGGQP